MRSSLYILFFIFFRSSVSSIYVYIAQIIYIYSHTRTFITGCLSGECTNFQDDLMTRSKRLPIWRSRPSGYEKIPFLPIFTRTDWQKCTKNSLKADFFSYQTTGRFLGLKRVFSMWVHSQFKIIQNIKEFSICPYIWKIRTHSKPKFVIGSFRSKSFYNSTVKKKYGEY